jgi:hypothetical protein
MNRIEKDELYQHLNDFLKLKGVELKQGSYTDKIQKGCALLSDAVNLGQKGFAQAKVEIDKKLEEMRQVIHAKTAPKAPSNPPGPVKPASPTGKASQKSATKPAPAVAKQKARKKR